MSSEPKESSSSPPVWPPELLSLVAEWLCGSRRRRDLVNFMCANSTCLAVGLPVLLEKITMGHYYSPNGNKLKNFSHDGLSMDKFRHVRRIVWVCGHDSSEFRAGLHVVCASMRRLESLRLDWQHNYPSSMMRSAWYGIMGAAVASQTSLRVLSLNFNDHAAIFGDFFLASPWIPVQFPHTLKDLTISFWRGAEGWPTAVAIEDMYKAVEAIALNLDRFVIDDQRSPVAFPHLPSYFKYPNLIAVLHRMPTMRPQSLKQWCSDVPDGCLQLEDLYLDCEAASEDVLPLIPRMPRLQELKIARSDTSQLARYSLPSTLRKLELIWPNLTLARASDRQAVASMLENHRSKTGIPLRVTVVHDPDRLDRPETDKENAELLFWKKLPNVAVDIY